MHKNDRLTIPEEMYSLFIGEIIVNITAWYQHIVMNDPGKT